MLHPRPPETHALNYTTTEHQLLTHPKPPQTRPKTIVTVAFTLLFGPLALDFGIGERFGNEEENLNTP